jgi:hypothetical protein
MQELSDRYTRTESCGQWKLIDDKIVWQNVTTIRKYDAILQSWIPTETKTEDLSPELSPFKMAKEFDIDVLILREKQTDDEAEKIVLIYDRKIHVAVKPDCENIWLTMSDDLRVYIKDLSRMYTYRFNLASDPQIKVKKISEKRISKEDAKLLKTGYIISKVEKIDDDTELFGQFVKPS